MRGRALFWFLAGVLTVVLAIVANPSPERHRQAIKEKIAERSAVAAMLRLGDLAAFVSNYHSVGVASYTRSGDRLMSVGAVGVVIVLDPEERR